MKLMSSAVTSSAAMVRSPSFSRSSSSQTMTILPRLMSSTISSIGLNGICYAPLENDSAMRGSSSRSTYLPITSASRFTLLPPPRAPRLVFARVWGSIETVNEPFPTETMVRLIPSTHILPFSTQYRSTASGASNSQISASPSGLTPSTSPTPSTCPCTMCPPNLLVAAMARSRLTGLPSPSVPSAVRLSVSGMAKNVSVPASASPTVRHAPFTEMLSPARVPPVTRSAEMPIRSISPSSSDVTWPTSSTSPVNMFLLSGDGGIKRDGHVLPPLLHLRDRKPERLGNPGRAERPDHGHALGAEQFWRVEQGHLVSQSFPDKARRRLSAALDQ